MAYLKLTHDNTTRYVEETDRKRLDSLIRDLGAKVEVDEEGYAVTFTAEEIQASFGRQAQPESLTELYGIKLRGAESPKEIKIPKTRNQEPKE